MKISYFEFKDQCHIYRWTDACVLKTLQTREKKDQVLDDTES